MQIHVVCLPNSNTSSNNHIVWCFLITRSHHGYAYYQECNQPHLNRYCLVLLAWHHFDTYFHASMLPFSGFFAGYFTWMDSLLCTTTAHHSLSLVITNSITFILVPGSFFILVLSHAVFSYIFATCY